MRIGIVLLGLGLLGIPRDALRIVLTVVGAVLFIGWVTP
jgi:hypothetical protein